MLKTTVLGLAAATIFFCTHAFAEDAVDILHEGLYTGTSTKAIAALQDDVALFKPDALRASGILKFFNTIEGLSQALYKHGIVAPETGPMGPALDLPIPVNDHPEPLDYQGVRDILQDFVTGMDEAWDMLMSSTSIDDDVDVFVIDPLQFRIDIDGDGVGSDYESISNIFQISPMPTIGEEVTGTPVPSESQGPAKDKLSNNMATVEDPQPTEAVTSESTIGFDKADAIWLAGYAQVLAAQSDFMLAHDFSTFVNAVFHRFFPQAGFPMQPYAEGGMLMIDPQTDTAIADAVAAIHSINWPVIDPERLAHVLERAQLVLAYSRQSWAAILEETDDNRELIPSPSQTPLVPDGAVTQEMVDAWMATLDTAQKVLDGDLLLPHWRFKQGFDLHAYFTTATHTDFIMLLTGYDAIPFIKDGPIASADSFAEGNRVFGTNFMDYVFWFN
jgi:hypothetical protein